MHGGGRSIKFEDVTTKAEVPNNDMAKLMYYLNCVNCLIDFDIPSKLRNYEKYRYLSYEEENEILCLAIILSPDEFVKRKVMVPVSKLDGGLSNRFFKITDTKLAFHVTSEFFIGGRQVHTLEIMFFEIDWLERNYSDPIKNYSDRIYEIIHGKPKPRPRTVHYIRVVESSNDSDACVIC